jgi:hypothetical protein
VQHEPSRCGPTASRARLTPVFPFAVGSALGSNASASCPHLNRLSRVGGEDGREHRLCPTTPFCDCGNRSGSARAAGSNHERDRGVDAGNLPFQRDVVWHLAGVALLLAALGLYGVLSFLVTQRRQAIGTRMASRASKSGVRKVFVRQGLALTVAGIRVGIAGARFVSRWLTSLLSGVTPADPFSFVAVSLELLAVTGAACGPGSGDRSDGRNQVRVTRRNVGRAGHFPMCSPANEIAKNSRKSRRSMSRAGSGLWFDSLDPGVRVGPSMESVPMTAQAFAPLLYCPSAARLRCPRWTKSSSTAWQVA